MDPIIIKRNYAMGGYGAMLVISILVLALSTAAFGGSGYEAGSTTDSVAHGLAILFGCISLLYVVIKNKNKINFEQGYIR
jgi:hypothetical protein